MAREHPHHSHNWDTCSIGYRRNRPREYLQLWVKQLGPWFGHGMQEFGLWRADLREETLDHDIKTMDSQPSSPLMVSCDLEAAEILPLLDLARMAQPVWGAYLAKAQARVVV